MPNETQRSTNASGPSANGETPQRLYGLPFAEVMHFDPATVYESEIEDQSEDYPERVEIEEWSVHPPEYHLPSADAVIEWMILWAAENGEGDEGLFDSFQGVATTPEIRAAAEALRSTIGAQVKYRMADTHLRSLWVTWNEDGEPLLDGEPLYVTATGGNGS